MSAYVTPEEEVHHGCVNTQGSLKYDADDVHCHGYACPLCFVLSGCTVSSKIELNLTFFLVFSIQHRSSYSVMTSKIIQERVNSVQFMLSNP